MRDFRDAKVIAHALRDALKAKAVEITQRIPGTDRQSAGISHRFSQDHALQAAGKLVGSIAGIAVWVDLSHEEDQA
jgi:hypothetical protein